MSLASPTKFNCPGCGKQYVWSERVAGKTAKCACGHVLQIPESLEASTISDEEPIDVNDAYGLAESDVPPSVRRAELTESEDLRFNHAVLPSRRRPVDLDNDTRNFREIEVTWPLLLFIVGLAVGVIALAAVVSSADSDKRIGRQVHTVSLWIETVALLMLIGGPMWTLFHARDETRPNGKPLAPWILQRLGFGIIMIALGAGVSALMIHSGAGDRASMITGGIVMTSGIGAIARTLAPRF